MHEVKQNRAFAKTGREKKNNSEGRAGGKKGRE